MTQPQATYTPDELVQDVAEAVEMLGAGYEQPAAIIDQPCTVKALSDKGLIEYKAWGWVKKSAKFIYHIGVLKGSKISTWDVISLSINENGECDLSAPEIAKLTKYSVSETRQAIKELDEMGYLSVTRLSGKRSVYKPIFTARGAKKPVEINPSSDYTPLVCKVKHATDPSSLSIENSAPTYKELKRVKKADKPLSPAEIILYREVVSKYPNKAAYDDVVQAIQKINQRLGRPAEAADLLPYFKVWCTKSGNEYNFSVWLLEWAVVGRIGGVAGVKNIMQDYTPQEIGT
jgi:hypothetical protein